MVEEVEEMRRLVQFNVGEHVQWYDLSYRSYIAVVPSPDSLFLLSLEDNKRKIVACQGTEKIKNRKASPDNHSLLKMCPNGHPEDQ